MPRLRLSVISAVSGFALVAAILVAAARPAFAGGTTYSNTSAITLNDPPSTVADASPYPSTIAVSGATGTISDLTVNLDNITYSFSQDIDALLVGPSGQTLILVASSGPAVGGSAAASDATLTFSDAGTLPTQSTPWGSSDTFKPVNFGGENETWGSPAPAGPYGDPGTAGTGATLASQFNGANPNGTWSLYVITTAAGDGTGTIAGGWSLGITTSPAAATTTVLASSLNPSFTSAPDAAVTLTAAVTSSSTPVTSGTVAFTDGGTTIAGCGAVTPNGSGRATCTATFTTEGIHPLEARYGGTSGFATSDGTLSQEADNHTTVNGTNYANSGAISVANPTSYPGAGLPYPSHVFVSGVTGTVSHLTATLRGTSYPYSQDLNVLLVGPTGASEILLGDVGPSTGTTSVSNVTATFDDSAASALAQNAVIGAPNSSVTSRPVDYGSNDDVFPSPAPTGPYGDPAPNGSSTLGQAFNGTNPNGEWSLYVVSDGPGDGSGSISGGWSIGVTTAAAAPTSTTVSSSINPSYTTSPDNSPIFTATVTSAGSPVTSGTVAFSAGGASISGCSGQPLDPAGQAVCHTSFSIEGDVTVQAAYGGTGSFGSSSGHLTEEVDAHTVVTGDSFANTDSISIPNATSPPGEASPYPSHIAVSGLGPVTALTATLTGVTYGFTQDLNALLVGPTGKSEILLGNVGPSTGTQDASNVTVTFTDAAASAIPQTTPLGAPGASVMSKPVDYNAVDTFPAPAPVKPYGEPAPAGSGTLAGAFNGTNPDGTWSLYLVTDGAGDGAGAVAGGWSLTFTPDSQTVTFTSPAPTHAVVSGARYTPTATGGASGSPVIFTIDGTSTAGACSIASGVVSFTGVGTCVVDANQAGNANYTAAPQVQQRIAVGRVTTTGAGGSRLAITPDRKGYWVLGAGGAVVAFGTAVNYGSEVGVHLAAPVVGIVATPDGKGYWLVGGDGGVFNFGDAGFHGSTGGVHLAASIVGMAATPDGKGYWLVGGDGGVFNFGDAGFHGSTGGVHLAAPVVGIVATPDGKGYWLVGGDGGVFNFGDAGFHGSTGGVHLAASIVGMAATPDGKGYWLVGADGGVFNFGDAAFHGSTAGVSLTRTIGLYSSPTGDGYTEVDAAGTVTHFGST